ncbi:MAG: PVC-type heme-binding CxxCH protein [Limisphaerales bacterium]
MPCPTHHLAAGACRRKETLSLLLALATLCSPLSPRAQQFDRGQEPPLLPPEQSALAFTTPDDLQMDLVLAEPTIAQPLHLSFDEQGRLWVVEYRQYPEPAGLTQISHDKFWRSVYDKIPPPPPNHFPGKDRISIHEDTDGDGTFDAHKVFVDGLNIATSAARGRGGVWVMNPPYLLFYPDKNNDDVPDAAPEVHLSGFGLEDTHSVANSLRWGPDGWLYACQGSTVSGHIKVEPLPTDKSPVSTNIITSLGQNIWRYQPETRRYEVFSEGGGNAFGIEMDNAGRIFSGHNGGDTRGFHYVQGAYLQKGFQKHGELSNPYAFGYFPQMHHDQVERFTHTFLIYNGNSLPSHYENQLFGIEPLQGRVVLSAITPTRSTFETRDITYATTTSDRWFRPVDIKLGPDGAIYIADWHDFSINHWRNYNGNMDATSGRVWRLRNKNYTPVKPFNLAKADNSRLLLLLGHPDRWWRNTASRLLSERSTPSLPPALATDVRHNTGPAALHNLWTWQSLQIQNRQNLRPLEAELLSFLRHKDPQIRLWTTRFIGDPYPGSLDTATNTSIPIPPTLASNLTTLASTEPHIEVRIQLAATAKRLPAPIALPIIKALASRSEDNTDPRQPLMIWWALESKISRNPTATLDALNDPPLWNQPLVQQHLLTRTMRRFAQAGSHDDLLACARLLNLAPSKQHAALLMQGFEAAFQGRSLTGLPMELIDAINQHGVGSLPLGVRRNDPQAIQQALTTISNPDTPTDERRQLVEIFGELKTTEALPLLIQLAHYENDPDLLRSTFAALQSFDNPDIAPVTLQRLPSLPPTAITAALSLLTSRPTLSLALLSAVQNDTIPPQLVPPEYARKLKATLDESLHSQINNLWPKSGRPSSEDMANEIHRLSQALNEGHGDPYRGKAIYNTTCASCHTLFSQGGDIGPNLTSLNRNDIPSLLLAIVNPSAEIREGYENFSLDTTDDRSLSGFIVQQDASQVVIRGLDGQNIAIPRSSIDTLKPAGLSLMPEGLTSHLDDQQARDLLAYLRSSQPLSE